MNAQHAIASRVAATPCYYCAQSAALAGLDEHQRLSGLTKLQLRSLYVGHYALAQIEQSIKEEHDGHLCAPTAKAKLSNARQDTELFLYIADLHTKDPEAAMDRERRHAHVQNNTILDASHKT